MLISIALLVYPVLVYMGLSHGYGQQVAYLLGALLLGRLLLACKHRGLGNWLVPMSTCGLLVVVGALVQDEPQWLQLYPVVANLVMALTFFISLYQQQSMIERFARLQEPNLSAQGVRYTRKVTQIWVLFFVLNTAVSGYTVYLADMKIWTLYNGLIAYILMGTLGACEYGYRYWLKRQGRLV